MVRFINVSLIVAQANVLYFIGIRNTQPTDIFINRHLVSLTTNNRLQFYGCAQSAIIFAIVARRFILFPTNDNIIKVDTMHISQNGCFLSSSLSYCVRLIFTTR